MENKSITLLNNATKMLAEVETIDDAKTLMDKASAAKHYAQKHKLGQGAVNYAHTIAISAEIKLGEILRDMEKHPPGPEKKDRSNTTTDPPTLKEIGITKDLSSEAQILAGLTQEDQEKVKSGKTTKTKAIREIKRAVIREEKISRPMPDNIFNVILCDPPWQYEHEISDSRKIENQYPTMPIEKIAALSIPAADDSVLFMWTTNPKLKEALWVMGKWGFDYRTNLVWVKDKIGMGYYLRSQHELLLIGKKGNYPVPEPSNRPSSVLSSPRLEHSKKPILIYDLIEKMYPEAKKIELFQRGEKRIGWACWSNEPEVIL